MKKGTDMPGNDIGSGEIHAMSHILACRIGVFSPPFQSHKGGWGFAQVTPIILTHQPYCFTMKGIVIFSLC